MGQYQSYKEQQLENRVARIEQDLIQLKTSQKYGLAQMNMTHRSDSVGIRPYYFWQNITDYVGVYARLSFISPLPEPAPRIWVDIIGKYETANTRVMVSGKNSLDIYVFVYTSYRGVVASEDIYFRAVSNIPGVLKLEKTYVIPTVG